MKSYKILKFWFWLTIFNTLISLIIFKMNSILVYLQLVIALYFLLEQEKLRYITSDKPLIIIPKRRLK